jgi:hypothetical protein
LDVTLVCSTFPVANSALQAAMSEVIKAMGVAGAQGGVGTLAGQGMIHPLAVVDRPV